MKNIKRTFIPGSEWFYLKLYTGENTADDLLLKAIKPIIKKIKNVSRNGFLYDTLILISI